MTVPMDNNTVAPSSRELAERLYRKNVELETNLRKFAKSRVPSDPNTWFQIRENYESIILEDHDFSEKRDIELALWQLHYRKIEEFRALLNAAKSLGSASTEGGRNPPKPESIKKIRSGFKTFLSESTGFYHDLILKIKAKFALPLGLFSDGPDSQIIVTKDEKKSTDMKKGMMSCHRSLIYLGDLARYKGSYGEGDSISREFSAASSYYTQAASLCPSSGNPHHQLAIIASFSGDDLVSIYRYFRSLAADIPFSTARDNLIIAFERNRQSFSLLPSKPNGMRAKPLAARLKGRGRGRADARLSAKSSKSEAITVKECELNTSEVLKSFCTRFVRVNGILFTRTSLETFGEVLSSVKKDLLNLLSSGPMDEFNFGPDAAENGLLIVRLIAILIFTVHNVNKESDSQSYAEILQKTVLLRNAYTAAFEFTGHLIKRCEQLHDVGSSFLLPAILVFTEWLACHHDIAVSSSSDAEEKQADARSFFWNQLVILMNKLTSSGLVTVSEDEDETFLSDICGYDEEETSNRLALWEDFELRGFLPLVPAQIILDFSKKHTKKDKQARAQRLLAAVRALMNVVRVGQKVIYFDPRHKKFAIGVESEMNYFMPTSQSDASVLSVTKQASPVKCSSQQKVQLSIDVEDDEEEIVFKPSVAEKYPIASASTSMSAALETIHSASASTSMSAALETIHSTQISAHETIQPTHTLHSVNLNTSKLLMDQAAMLSNELKNHHNGTGFLPNHVQPTAFTPQLNHFSQQALPMVNLNTSKWLMEQAALSSGLKNLSSNGNGTFTSNGSQYGMSSMPSTFVYPSMVSSSVDPITRPVGHSKATEALNNSTLNATITSRMTSTASRPVRHVGPPPGFSNIPSKQLDQPKSESMLNGQFSHIDDYSWLDGYEAPSIKTSVMENVVNNTAPPSDGAVNFNGAMNFPFPGKHIPNVQPQIVNGNWKDIQLFEHLMLNSEHQKPGYHV